jgi:iron complex outermembrane receptor protein
MIVRLRVIRSARRPASPSFKAAVGRVLRRGHVCLAVAALMAIPAWSQEPPKNISDLSIEDLMNLKVTSVSKKEQKMSQVAAAIFVITQEDIRRSGATGIPDLLRMVPGLDVAETTSNIWAVSSRGFNSVFASKLLVLIDGRTVYTPLFGGTYWDVQDVPLEDIERIEVIRGPGATVWGANAVNGVINIITKKSKDTQGASVAAGGGTHEQEFGTVQYGGTTGPQGSYRVFAKYLNDGPFPGFTGQNARDGWHQLHGGFRVDQDYRENDSITVEGDLYHATEGVSAQQLLSIAPIIQQAIPDIERASGGDLLGRWHHIFSTRSDTTLQIYFDRYERDYDPFPLVNETRDTLDFDFQNHLAWGDRQDLIWGLGYRRTSDQTSGGTFSFLTPVGRTLQEFSSFVQDQITLKPGRVFLTVGTKLEHNDFNGFVVEPSIHLVWTPGDRHSLWAAVSDAARTTSEFNADATLGFTAFPTPGGTVAVVEVLGGSHLQSERELTYELGYRTQLAKSLSVDVTGFFSSYTNLLGFVARPPFFSASPAPPHLVIPLVFENSLHASSDGFEASANWKVASRWTLSPGFAFLQLRQRPDSPTEQVTVFAGNGSDPRHQAQIRSHLELGRGLGWDTSAYFVGRLAGPGIASYTRLDTELTIKITKQAELSLVGQNLLRDHHPEFSESTTPYIPSQVKRSAYARLLWRFGATKM